MAISSGSVQESNQLMENKLTSGVPTPARSIVRQMEELLPQIEDGLAQGYPHVVMHAALPSLGINITLTYYHRVLRILRKKRLEGERPPSSTLPAELATHQTNKTSSAKAGNLTPVIAATVGGESSNIGQDTDLPMSVVKPFRWSGQEFLERDWSKF